MSGEIHICAPTPEGFGLQKVDKCPDCGRHTRMIYTDYEWYGRARFNQRPDRDLYDRYGNDQQRAYREEYDR